MLVMVFIQGVKAVFKDNYTAFLLLLYRRNSLLMILPVPTHMKKVIRAFRGAGKHGDYGGR